MPLSFLRLELHVPYHRRYDLAFDSSFVTYRQVETPGKSRKRAEIRYYISYVYFTTSRPKQPRMELRLQMTYLVPLQITHSHLQILHILLVFQLVAQLVETGTLKNPTPDDRTNPYYPDLPILNSRKTFRRHFHGTTLFHATIQSFVQCLHATKYRELGIYLYIKTNNKPFSRRTLSSPSCRRIMRCLLFGLSFCGGNRSDANRFI